MVTPPTLTKVLNALIEDDEQKWEKKGEKTGSGPLNPRP